MDIDKFISERPFLYHLTSKENAENIIVTRRIFSTNELIRMSENEGYLSIGRERRPKHKEIVIKGKSYWLRDQRPISEVNLAKSLTDGWTVADFLYHLNDRVFMWPTESRLWSHFTRYEGEQPIIFRFSTRDMLEANSHVKFCRLNSGATRSNSYLGGAPPQRGALTFLSAEDFDRTVREVAEVTFEKSCLIAGKFSRGNRPDGKFFAITS